jgi:hypothetical protein
MRIVGGRHRGRRLLAPPGDSDGLDAARSGQHAREQGARPDRPPPGHNTSADRARTTIGPAAVRNSISSMVLKEHVVPSSTAITAPEFCTISCSVWRGIHRHTPARIAHPSCHSLKGKNLVDLTENHLAAERRLERSELLLAMVAIEVSRRPDLNRGLSRIGIKIDPQSSDFAARNFVTLLALCNSGTTRSRMH